MVEAGIEPTVPLMKVGAPAAIEEAEEPTEAMHPRRRNLRRDSR